MWHLPRTSHPAPGELVRVGANVDLRRHSAADRDAFISWYQDPEIATMLRHDLSPLTMIQARGYFDTIVMPASRSGTCWAIAMHNTGQVIGTTAIVDIDHQSRTSLFRILIGEREAWGNGYGTEATDLVLAEAFERLGLLQVNLEVFQHNPRAQAVYRRNGCEVTGRHVEWVARVGRNIEVVEMAMTHARWNERGLLHQVDS